MCRLLKRFGFQHPSYWPDRRPVTPVAEEPEQNLKIEAALSPPAILSPATPPVMPKAAESPSPCQARVRPLPPQPQAPSRPREDPQPKVRHSLQAPNINSLQLGVGDGSAGSLSDEDSYWDDEEIEESQAGWGAGRDYAGRHDGGQSSMRFHRLEDMPERGGGREPGQGDQTLWDPARSRRGMERETSSSALNSDGYDENDGRARKGQWRDGSVQKGQGQHVAHDGSVQKGKGRHAAPGERMRVSNGVGGQRGQSRGSGLEGGDRSR